MNEQLTRAKAAIAKLPSGGDITFRRVPIDEFTKSEVIRILSWQIERHHQEMERRQGQLNARLIVRG